MRLRQIVFAAGDLETVTRSITSVLGLEVCFRDPGVGKFGLANTLIPVDGNFIEVVAPDRDDTAVSRHLARLGGDGGYMVIVQGADALADRERVVASGVRSVWEHDLDDAIATHFHPADVPGAILAS